MAKYTLTVRKEDMVLELVSEDKEFIEKELGNWITLTSESLETSKPEPPVEKTVEEEVDEEDEDVKEALKKLNEAKKAEEETKEILRKAIHEPEEATKTVEEKVVDSKAEEVEVVDDFSKVFKEKMSQQTQEVKPEETLEEEIPQVPSTTQDTTIDKFASIVSSNKVKNSFDCLIACAYHLVERENFERFTLKQINTLAKALIENPIEHDVLKEALDKKYIKVVPDYTGTSDTMEYTLTNAGIGYFKDELE